MHTATLRVRGYECDPYGHVNNAVYLNYLEAARDQLLTDLGLDYQALMSGGGGIWVAEAQLKFVSPAVHGDELTIRSVQEEAGAVSAVLLQTIVASDRLVLTARMKLVWVSGGRPSRIPSDWKTTFAERLAP